MSDTADSQGTSTEAGQAASTDCPLTYAQQTRNVYLFGINTALIYLAAPVLYVGLLQAALCKTDEIKATDFYANLPSSVYLFCTPLAVLIAWYFPFVRMFKPLLCMGYIVMGIGGAVVVAALKMPTMQWVIPALLVHAALVGLANGVVWTFQWEVLGRCVSQSRRGQAMALAYGFGPILAVVGSVVTQLVLSEKGTFLIFSLPRPVPFPDKFIVLFGASMPIMGLTAFLSTRFIVPKPAVEVVREPFIAGVFGGLKEYLSYRLIFIAVLVYVLMYVGGNAIQTNIALYSQVQTGQPVDQFTGWQMILRFGFKAVAGIFLGWLLIRTNPRTVMMVTGGLCLAGIVWAMAVPGVLYLLSFGFLGAGELFGAYYPNYVVYLSPKSKIRRNMAYTNFLTIFVGFAPVMYGDISDRFGAGPAVDVLGTLMTADNALAFLADFHYYTLLKKHGLEASFVVAIAIVVVTLLIVQFALTTRPRPRDADMTDADRELARTG